MGDILDSCFAVRERTLAVHSVVDHSCEAQGLGSLDDLRQQEVSLPALVMGPEEARTKATDQLLRWLVWLAAKLSDAETWLL